ncbi:ROK family transcriptional regulator [Actinocorallia longicatena]|uniref:ROK family protein n=1 Tax=Actinocorallia longicatena TaxID=111803 RepID=A0ABP6PZS4_9ACTN
MTTTASSTALLRVINERAALEQIREHGPISRPELAKNTGLSKPTISLALADLERVGLVRTVGQRTGGAGRSAMLYEVSPEAGWVVGVDVGREWVRVALANIAGEVVTRRDVRSQARSAAALMDQIGELVAELAGGRELTHVVLATPGIHDHERRRLQLAPNIPGWQKPGVVDKLAERLPCAFTIENDIALAALGEQAYGLGRGLQNFTFVSIGTGLGMGVVLGGRLYRGSRGAAGEIGFLPLGGGPDHPGGQLESVLSGPGLVATAQRYGMKGRWTPETIYAAARQGDENALQIVGEEAANISRALASVIAVLDPELIVLGGGLGHTGADLLLEAVRDRLESMTPLPPPPVELSALEGEAIVRGAVATALGIARDALFSRAVAEPVGAV